MAACLELHFQILVLLQKARCAVAMDRLVMQVHFVVMLSSQFAYRPQHAAMLDQHHNAESASQVLCFNCSHVSQFTYGRSRCSLRSPAPLRSCP